MKLRYLLIVCLGVLLLHAGDPASKVFPLSKSKFAVVENGKEKIVDLSGQDYIVVSLRE